MAKRRKPKPLIASVEVRRRARLAVGSPPPVKRHATPKQKLPKHKKREWEDMTE
jgi:hypothetical protein